MENGTSGLRAEVPQGTSGLRAEVPQDGCLPCAGESVGPARMWVKEIWSVLGEVAMHLHSVSHFASQGFDQQGLHCQSLQHSVDVLSFE
eukprot:434545-Amphidinium_carterae.1